MKLVKKVNEMMEVSSEMREAGEKIGFVATLGALHSGHLSLIKAARKQSSKVVVSIFLNPTQFAPHEDLEDYPQALEKDLKKCEEEGVDVVFAPSTQQMYPSGFQSSVEVEGITNKLEGKFRPHHFRGVTTVVAKLFNIVKPHTTFFGQKDFQQALVIKRMIQDLNFDLKLKTRPVVRAKDGLAVSSRNQYLSKQERKQALSLFKALQLAKKMVKEGERSPRAVEGEARKRIEKEEDTEIDYVAVRDTESLGEVEEVKPGETVLLLAVTIGKTRLIDNTIL